jgi:hypothetical protein
MMFNAHDVKIFRFISYAYDEKKAVATFEYAFDNGPHFVEQLIFNGVNKDLGHDERAALDICLQNLCLILGISYYKAAAPGEIRIEGFDISPATAHFFETLYVNGLSEYSYRNGIDLRGRVKFPYVSHCKPNASSIELPRRTAVPIGGGKDSIVTLEILKSYGEPIVLFSLGDFKPIKNVIDKANLPSFTVSRKISPKLIEINSQGALNGHVPISAIIAFILPLASLLYGFDVATLSNERSANIGNLEHNGIKVNHQYSKSYDFEKRLSEYLRTSVLANFKYFSFLRPLSELAIARIFTRFTSHDSIFTSCNRSFKITGTLSDQRWCLGCPKCLSTFLMLAPFMKKERLLSIFGYNILNDPLHAKEYDELIGVFGHKPFDCVGTDEEHLAAFCLLSNNADWESDFLVKRFSEKILPKINNPEQLISAALTASAEHLLPPHFEKILNAYL